MCLSQNIGHMSIFLVSNTVSKKRQSKGLNNNPVTYYLRWHKLSLKKHDRRIVSEKFGDDCAISVRANVNLEFLKVDIKVHDYVFVKECLHQTDMVVVYTMQCCRGDFWWWQWLEKLHLCLVLLMYRSPTNCFHLVPPCSLKPQTVDKTMRWHVPVGTTLSVIISNSATPWPW